MLTTSSVQLLTVWFQLELEIGVVAINMKIFWPTRKRPNIKNDGEFNVTVLGWYIHRLNFSLTSFEELVKNKLLTIFNALLKVKVA